MNIEELKMVMDTVAQLGESGKAAFIWWLVLDKLTPAIAWLVCAGLAFLLGRRAMGLFISGPSAYFRSLRVRLRIGSSGELTDFEIKQIQERINQILEDKGI